MNLAMKCIGTGIQWRQTRSCTAFNGDIKNTGIRSHGVGKPVVIRHTHWIRTFHINGNMVAAPIAKASLVKRRMIFTISDRTVNS